MQRRQTQAKSGQTEPGQATTGQMEPGQEERSKTESGQAESGRGLTRFSRKLKGLGSMLTRYVGAAIGVGVCLLVLNFSLMVQFVLSCQNQPAIKDRVITIANGVEVQPDGAITVSPEARQALQERYAWAMLLNPTGEVIWSDRMPDELPRRYTVADVAAFSRWYLGDYPVYCWENDAGLVVLASAPGTEWKYLVIEQETTIRAMGRWLPSVLLLNLLTAFVLALLMGWQMYRAMSPVAQGLSDLAAGHPVELKERGVLWLLASHLNRASAQLRQQQYALQQRDRTRTEWIAGVSHDIRTPLSLVQGLSAQLAADGSLSADTQRKAEQICVQSQKIGRLVRDLNLASKLIYAVQPLHVTRFRPAALVRTVAAELLNSLDGLREPSDGAVSLVVDIPSALSQLTAHGDEALLTRAIENVLRNSIAHNRGAITLQLALTALPEGWSLAITDDGSGLSDETLARLRTPLTGEIPAHGLGLVLVQQIMRAHGGTACFVNQHPGLRVTLTVPDIPPSFRTAPSGFSPA